MSRINDLSSGVPLTKAYLQKLPMNQFNFPGLEASVLRLDAIDEVISGNKWFKLKWHLAEALEKNAAGLVTFGGAYSNHLVATAAACHQFGIPSVGIIRGEEPANPSPGIQEIKKWGMRLHFVSRTDFRNKEELQKNWEKVYPQHYWVPEGGGGALGVKGAREIMDLIPDNHYTRIFCALGTGTMMEGLLQGANADQLVCAVPVLKWTDKDLQSLSFVKNSIYPNARFYNDYHEGGYAKYNDELLAFMNRFYQLTGIPTDFVYTAKLFRAFISLAEKGEFADRERILLIHSGGLQGNRSLPQSGLLFN